MQSLTTSSVLTLLTHEQQVELYNTLHDRLSKLEDHKTARDKIKEIQEKYFDLVWMARKDDDLLEERPDIRKIFDEVSSKYPGELEKLASETGDWTHGFNSGMLACARVLSPYTLPYGYRKVIEYEDSDGEEFALTRDSEIEFAEESFPMLDT